MGFFSADCHSCGHPLLSYQACNRINMWMNDGVAIAPNGAIGYGCYDGYGKLDDDEELTDIIDFDAVNNDGDDFWEIGASTVWHHACWEIAGKPTDYRGASQYSEDQGWFFDKGAHDMAEPK